MTQANEAPGELDKPSQCLEQPHKQLAKRNRIIFELHYSQKNQCLAKY